MKLVCISDTHNLCPNLEIPECDVLIHAGDGTMGGSESEMGEFLNWFEAHPGKHKLYVPGNHDFCLDVGGGYWSGSDPTILTDNGIEIDGTKFWGSPWQSNLPGWAFHKSPKEISEKWDLIPRDTDVLITHVPPYGLGDTVVGGKKVGCATLRRRTKELDLKLHVFGHIHEGYGSYNEGRSINVSICDERYSNQFNKPVVIEL